MTRVAVPSVADINQTRESRFAQALTAAMTSDRLDDFRGLLARYERDNDVPAADIAAALAVLIHEQQPQLLPLADDDEIPEPGPAPTSPARDRGPAVERAPYTIAVGREDFGRIDIRGDHSIVELPARLSPQVWKALKSTRISGKLIDLTPSNARKPRQRQAR
jgi:ATP-dependent RNA helicase DeaD